MVFYINKQAVEIKTRFENAPLTSPNEACAAIGMLCRIYGLPIPEKREAGSPHRHRWEADPVGIRGESLKPFRRVF